MTILKYIGFGLLGTVYLGVGITGVLFSLVHEVSGFWNNLGVWLFRIVFLLFWPAIVVLGIFYNIQDSMFEFHKEEL